MKPRIFKWGGFWMHTYSALSHLSVQPIAKAAQTFCDRLNQEAA